MTAYSSFFARKIPWNFQWSLVGYSIWGQKESDMIEYTCTYLYEVSFFIQSLSQSGSSVAQLCLTLRLHELQQNRLPCPSPNPGACSNLCTSSQWCHPTISSCHPLLLLLPSVFPNIRVFFWWVSSLHQVAKVLELQLQHQSFQWIFRIDFILDWLVWSPCSPRNSQESSSTPQFKSINSSVFNLLYGPTLTSLNDYWRTCSFY